MNYGFLSFYYLENNKYIYTYIKKNILLYRIFSIISAVWCNYNLMDYYLKLINMQSHKYYSLKNPNIRKKWYFNYIKKYKNYKLLSPLINNSNISIFKKKVNFQSYSNILIYRPRFLDKKLFIILNFIFKIFWFIFFKLIIVKFFDIITLINTSDNLNFYFLNFKYNLEFILWEIFYSNDNRFVDYKNYLSFYFVFNKIKIDNLLSIFYTKYYNSILYTLLFYNNKDNNIYFVNFIFLISFLCDLFFNIIVLKNKFISNLFFLFFNNLNLFYKFKLNYSLFFFYNFNCYLMSQRWNKYYLNYEYTYFSDINFYLLKIIKMNLNKLLKYFILFNFYFCRIF